MYMKELSSLLLGVIVMGIFVNYFYKNMYLTKVRSTIDNRIYIVRKLPDKLDAANKLAMISEKLTKLVDYVYRNHKNKYGIQQLNDNFNSRNITENLPNGKYTAYSVNKGEELAICLRNVPDDTFIDDNLILFVCIHEISHVMTDEIGHPPKFWENMRFLLEQAEQLGIYKPENYKVNPKMYCGKPINSTPYKFN